MRSSRRNFITGIASASAALAVNKVAAQEQEVSANADSEVTFVTGNGPHRFELQRAWGDPGDKAFGPTHGGVVILPSGEIACSTDNKSVGIAVFSPEGEFVRSFGKFKTHSLDLHEEDGESIIWATDLDTHTAYKMNLEGEKLLELFPPEEVVYNPSHWNPTGTAVAPDGSIYVADGYSSSKIFRFDPEGNFIQAFGGRGNREDQFSCAHGLALETRHGEPCLLAVDRENRRLMHWSLEGEYLGTWARGLRRPCTTRAFGDYTAVAELEGRVTLLDKEGIPVAFLGDNPDKGHWSNFGVSGGNRAGLPQDVFTAPHGLSWDDQGNLYILEWNVNGRITKLSPFS